MGREQRHGGNDEQRRMGLCATCAWRRVIRSDRGAVYYLCRRALTDPRFPKYPSLPVLSCTGWEKQPQSGEPLNH